MWEFEALIAHPHGEMPNADRIYILNADERSGLETEIWEFSL